MVFVWNAIVNLPLRRVFGISLLTWLNIVIWKSSGILSIDHNYPANYFHLISHVISNRNLAHKASPLQLLGYYRISLHALKDGNYKIKNRLAYTLRHCQSYRKAVGSVFPSPLSPIHHFVSELRHKSLRIDGPLLCASAFFHISNHESRQYISRVRFCLSLNDLKFMIIARRRELNAKCKMQNAR